MNESTLACQWESRDGPGQDYICAGAGSSREAEGARGAEPESVH